MKDWPLVLFGSITGPPHRGDDAYNGGYKAHALWVKLLRQHGVEAYRVTRDGEQVPWLIETPPTLSLEQAWALKRAGRALRVVTTWIVADEFLALAEDGPIWFYDQEMAFTTTSHRAALERRLPQLKIATHNRMTQAWYMATFGLTPAYIPEWSDRFWKPAHYRRIRGLVGWLDEGPHSAGDIGEVIGQCALAGCSLTEMLIRGTEREVLEAMQCCDFYAGLNRGKHPLWGEGCPRGQQEAMHAGAVVVAYDVKGNREYLHHGFNGLLVQTPGEMAEALVTLMKDRERCERMRWNGLQFARHAFGPEGRWPLIRDWLGLT